MTRELMERAAQEWEEKPRWDRFEEVFHQDDLEMADALANLVWEAEHLVKIPSVAPEERTKAQGFLDWIDRRLARERDSWETARAQFLDTEGDEADHAHAVETDR